MSIGEERYWKVTCVIVYIYRKDKVLPPSFMSSGRVGSKKIAKLMKIDSVRENAKLLQKLVKSIFSVSHEMH